MEPCGEYVYMVDNRFKMMDHSQFVASMFMYHCCSCANRSMSNVIAESSSTMGSAVYRCRDSRYIINFNTKATIKVVRLAISIAFQESER